MHQRRAWQYTVMLIMTSQIPTFKYTFTGHSNKGKYQRLKFVNNHVAESSFVKIHT